MEQLNVHGLCVREADSGENDKIITLVTMEYGKMTVTGKGVRSLKSRNMASCQPFCYSLFTLRRTNKYFYVAESELIESFYDLRSDLDRLSLAAYICDVCADVSVENMEDPEILRLTLNTLYALCSQSYHPQLVKAAFELKCADISGFCPELDCCALCGGDSAKIYLDVMNGRILCGDCKARAEREAEADDDGTARLYLSLTHDVLSAMQYVIAASVSRFLSFSLDEDGGYLFSRVCEAYLLNHLEHGFHTLEFYKSIII